MCEKNLRESPNELHLQKFIRSDFVGLLFFWSCLLCREVLGLAKGYVEEAEEADGGGHHKKKQQQYRVTWKSVKNKSDNKNASVKRLLSGAFAGAVSRTAVAPIEAIRTHLMVGTGAASISSMVQDILRTDGWQGFFRGNGVNVIRVAPSKAIEVHTYV
jgi:solute carrier family 25 phosphate transporter 23/24/25/41